MTKHANDARRDTTKLSLRDLRAELALRERGISKLRNKHAKLAAKAAALEAQIRELGGSVSGGLTGRGSRPRNTKNLVESMAQLLKGKTLSVTDIAQAVQDAGYRTTSPNFRTIVNQALINSPLFKNISRGKYTLKG